MGIVLCEMALGRFPFPLQDDDAEDAVPPTEGQPLPRPSFLELFDWLDADTPSPSLPASRFSDECRAFVDACLEKQTEDRASFDALLAHDFLEGKAAADAADGFSMKAWIRGVYANRNAERVRDIRQHPWRYSAEDKAEVFGSDDPDSGSGPDGLVDDDDRCVGVVALFSMWVGRAGVDAMLWGCCWLCDRTEMKGRWVV